MRYKGVVKWFNNTKGYGFILSDDFSEELFVHYSYVDMEGYKTLKADQVVTFETQQTPTGFHAKAVQIANEHNDHIGNEQPQESETLASPVAAESLSASHPDAVGNTYNESASDPVVSV